MPFVVGENVGPYRITARLGQGGMATVYRAYHANLDRYVAIKVLHAALKEDSTFLARFQREAQIVAKLEHSNIVPTYDYSEHNGEPYLVMKFIEGETLKGRLERQPLTLDETLRIMSAIAQALTYAHDQGVLHRDIKPSNILLEKGVTPYLADFGLARMAMAGESTLSQDMMLGTPQYISPEQAQGIKDLDAATDLYSFGVVLYELVVGRVPFNADTPYAIVHDHIFSPLPLPSKVNPQVTASVERVLLKSLAKSREDRYTSAVGMIEAFRAAVNEDNLTDLSPRSYRVPMPGGAPLSSGSTIIDPTGSGVPSPVATSTPFPMATPAANALPPMPGSPDAMGSSAARRYAAQQRRGNLWKLGGFASLILTCLAGMFILIGALTDSGIQTSMAGQPLNTAKATQLNTTPGRNQTQAALTKTAAAVSAASTAVTPTQVDTATTQATATPLPPTQGNSAGGSPTPTVTLIAIPSVQDAEKYVKDHPDDGAGYMALYLADLKDGRPLKAQNAWQTGFKLLKDNPAESFGVAQQFAGMVRDKGVSGLAWPTAALYGLAYAGSTDAVIRSEAGEYLYHFSQGINKPLMPNYKELVDSTRNDPGAAGMYAFLAVALWSVDNKDDAISAEKAAIAISNSLAEVVLVQGILYAQSGKSAEAVQAFKAVENDRDAPRWAVDEAQSQRAALQTSTPTKGS